MLAAYPVQDVLFCIGCVMVFSLGFIGGRLR